MKQHLTVVLAFGFGVLVTGAGLLIGGAGAQPGRMVPAPVQPIYGVREMADAELTVVDNETTYSYWTDQEDKWQNALTGTRPTSQCSEQEAAITRQIMSLMFRAQSAKQDAGLQRDRSTRRLATMKQLNSEAISAAMAK